MSSTSPGHDDAGPWDALRRRKLVQWSLGYAAAAWTLLQALEYLLETFRWPDSVREYATLGALLGLPLVLVIAWYHGDRGTQRITTTEVLVVALLLLAGGGVLWRYEPGGESGASPAVPDPTMPQARNEASVAVLPFVALSAGEDDGFFADGLTEEIINALSALPDLLVTARASAFHFKGRDVPIPEVAAALGVAYVVEGSVRRSGDTVRITAQLTRAADGFNRWSASYDHASGNVFAVQTQIAESVADALGVLLDERKRTLMHDVGVRDVETFVAFQRGVALFDRAHNEGPLMPLLARANTQFEAAIARKADFAQAHFYHADLYAHFLIDEAPGKPVGFVSAAGVGVEEAERRLIADLDASFHHERDPAQRLVVQVVRTTVSSDWRHLDEQLVRAYASWNNCRHGLWIDQTAIIFGHGEEALAHDLRRARCDPLGGNWSREAMSAIWLGRAADGLRFADRAEARRGHDREVMFARILAHLALGEVGEAEALFAAGAFDPANAPEFMLLLALQIPAAAGRADAWAALRLGLDADPERLLVGAAVFGDRETANRAAASIDAMVLGPTILLRIADRCGCGAPFDLDATPRLALLLREAKLPWSPARPIAFPLKTW